MSCQIVTGRIPLYLYGELTAEEEERVEAHVHECPECQREMDCQKRLHRVFVQGQVEVPPALLAECRADLVREVYRTPAAAPVRVSWRDRLAAFWMSAGAIRLPAGALALVALGFFGARFTAGTPGQAGSLQPPADIVASSIRSVQPDSASGRVQIALDETRRRVFSGSLEDQNIRRMLLAAARDEANPGLRVDSIDLLATRPVSPDVRGALLAALQHDTNAGVRLKALEGLKSMADDAETRRALVQALLTDQNPGVRVQAIDLLMQHRDESLVGVLQSVVRHEPNNYVRLKCQNALQDMNASVGTF